MTKTNYENQTIGGKYRIIRLLGQGGMGSVYLGEHVIIGKKIAVKFLHTEFTAKEDMVKRFYREAQVAAAISHRNIIDVMDVGVSQEGHPYIVMEYLEGESLADLLERNGPMDLSSACAILEPAFLALTAAHEKGIVHRDLKPENIFVVRQPGEPPMVKLIDLGVSKCLQQDGQSQLTQTGSFLGTPAYMAPEQIRGASEVNQSADLYSMGVIIYEILTGGLPFKGTHYNELLFNVMTEPPTPPKENYEDFPAAAEPLVMQLLEKDAAQRPASAKEIIDIISKYDEFENRKEQLEAYLGDLKQMTIASGTLGGSFDSDGSASMASDVLSQLSGKTPPSATPTGWTNTIITQPKKSGFVIAGLVALVLVIVGVLVGVLVNPKNDHVANTGNKTPTTKPAQAPAVPAAASLSVKKDEGVEINVTGHPAGAKIYYEDSLVLENPFRVKRATTVTRIAVEAPGFKTFRVSVIPTKDRIVQAELVPLPREPKAAAPTPVPATKREKKQEKKDVSRSKRSRKNRRRPKNDMIIAEDFE